MGYNTSNAALAYDMNAMPAYREAPQAPAAPRDDSKNAAFRRGPHAPPMVKPRGGTALAPGW